MTGRRRDVAVIVGAFLLASAFGDWHGVLAVIGVGLLLGATR